AQAEALKQRDRVSGKNLLGGLAGKHREQDGDEPAHDMSVAVAAEGERRSTLAIGAHGGRKPDLARTALHLVLVRAILVGQRAQSAAQLDDIAVAIVPLLQQ